MEKRKKRMYKSCWGGGKDICDVWLLVQPEDDREKKKRKTALGSQNSILLSDQL